MVIQNELCFFHAYIDIPTLTQGEMQTLNVKNHSLQLGACEVLEDWVEVSSGHSELDLPVSCACGSQCVVAAPLEVVSPPIKRDIVWVAVDATGYRLGEEAAFDTVYDLTHFVVCAEHGRALDVVVAHASALLLTLSTHKHCSFLNIKRRLCEYSLFWESKVEAG